MYTLLGGCEKWSELTLLDFVAQTESKYLKQGASKDIGTVRNMLNWIVACFVASKM
jgi:hypothetical protein